MEIGALGSPVCDQSVYRRVVISGRPPSLLAKQTKASALPHMDLQEERLDVPHIEIKTGIFIGIMVLLMALSWSKITLGLLTVLGIYLVTGNRSYWIYVLSKTCCRDMRFAFKIIKMSIKMWFYEKNEVTITKLFYKAAKKHNTKIAFFTESKKWKFEEVADLAKRSSHLFKNEGIKRGEVVGLMLANGGGAELPSLFLGLATMGGIGALIPPQLKGTALIHSISLVKAKIVVYSHHLKDVIEEIQHDPQFENTIFYQYNINDENVRLLSGAKSLNRALENVPNSLLAEDLALGRYKDDFIYIYTSGTTGLPKAAIIKHFRYLMIAMGLGELVNITPLDIIYTPLPLHHTAGGVLGVGQALVRGCSVALRAKFSASNFWKDCEKYNCTVAQYIGEICRFLLITAERSGEVDPAGNHRLRMMLGNGLRMNIWERFQRTFKVPQIYEFYGATEGNTNMINLSNQIGAVGFIPRLLSFLSPINLIKCDEVGEPIRDKDGLCIPCNTGEPGLMVGKLNHSKRLYTFSGYVDKEATKKKVLQNVFTKDDNYFNSGDILAMDHFGYFYFKDRTGDTFRWRGENCSTTEVESILCSILGLSDTTVYSVQIPHIEGKAGMAAIVDQENKIDLVKLKANMHKALPQFAHPVFIRIIQDLEVTSTFKIIKRNLQSDGFDVNKIKDKVYFLNPSTDSYVPLTLQLYEDIINGKARL